MKRPRLILAIPITLLVGILIGRSTVPVRNVEMTKERSDAGLDRVVTEVDFRDTPLKEIVTSLARTTSTNIIVRWEEMRSLNVEKDHRLTLRLENLPLGTVLTALASALPEEGYGGASFGVRDGVIVFSTKEDLDRDLVPRLYDLSDLLASFEDAEAREQRIEEILILLHDSADFGGFTDMGTVGPRIRVFGEQFAITTTPENHVRFEQVLGALRQAHAR